MTKRGISTSKHVGKTVETGCTYISGCSACHKRNSNSDEHMFSALS